MNREKIKALAVDAYEAKSDIFNVALFDKGPLKLLDMVIDEDKEKLIPYLQDEIRAAKNLGRAGEKYVEYCEAVIEAVNEEVVA